VQYVSWMGTTTVQLDRDDEDLLNKLAVSFGGRSNAIRAALRSLAEDQARQKALGTLLAEWELNAGPVAGSQVDAMGRRDDL
jgi:Arc/MetJ-type ribon-helix-helix transcriptional regulator